jgi:hypothetical protein
MERARITFVIASDRVRRGTEMADGLAAVGRLRARTLCEYST